jgi:surfeit locus 1 family protein
MKRIPVLPTLIVLIAVGYMIHLGFWQLDRLQQKDALMARYADAIANPAAVSYPGASNAAVQAALYRRSGVECRTITGNWESVSGRNAQGEAGFVHLIRCGLEEGTSATVQVGWSRDPKPPVWEGGKVAGFVAPFRKGARLVADPPLAGLMANARPDPENIPNNHLAYAVQWFLFAGVALVIYALALRKRWQALL